MGVPLDRDLLERDQRALGIRSIEGASEAMSPDRLPDLGVDEMRRV
jgi:hypothetical protein